VFGLIERLVSCMFIGLQGAAHGRGGSEWAVRRVWVGPLLSKTIVLTCSSIACLICAGYTANIHAPCNVTIRVEEAAVAMIMSTLATGRRRRIAGWVPEKVHCTG
jgi:hypothetical protein